MGVLAPFGFVALLAFFLAPMLKPEPANAATHLIPNINRDLPLFMEDARSIEPGSLQLQAATRYERTHEDTDQFFLAPQIQYGFSPKGFVQISATAILGSEPRQGTGDLTLAGFYSVLPDPKAPLKLAIYAQFGLPTGPGQSGLETETGVFATESLDGHEKNEIHLNLYWIHATEPEESELSDRYRAIVGYNHDVNEKWIFLADLVREQGPERNQFSNIFEIGTLYSSSTRQTLSVGLGAGLGEQSPKFRATLGYQFSFGS